MFDPQAARARCEAATVAQAFHEAYEELAPQFGYKTRDASAVPWADVPENNKALMIATCERVLQALNLPAALEALEEARETLQSWEEGTHPAIVEAQAKIEELSRQVAEAVWIEDLRQREERAEGRDIGCCAGRVSVLVEALEEAQGKLKAVREDILALKFDIAQRKDIEKWIAEGGLLGRLDRILSKEGE